MTIPVLFLLSDIYSFDVPSIEEGSQIRLADFHGKKILIVNTASNSLFTHQYEGLEQLYQKFKDSLVVIAFPSNSFNNEPGSNTAIKDFVENNYHVHFLLAAKTSVTGNDQSPFYQWLTTGSLSGMASHPVIRDFQKYLFDANGRLIGYFSAVVDPMSEDIQHAIQNQ